MKNNHTEKKLIMTNRSFQKFKETWYQIIVDSIRSNSFVSKIILVNKANLF